MDEWLEEALAPIVQGDDALGLEFSMEGSFPGMTALRLDEADMGVIANPAGDPLPERPMVAIPIAYQVAYVLVHESNQLREISKQRLAGIFGAAEVTDYGQWGQLGLLQWEAKTISGAIHSGEDSLADSIFRYTVLLEPELKGAIAAFQSAAEVEDFIAKNDNGIAITSRPPSGGNSVRSLPVAVNDDSPGYTANVDTVHFKDYDMRLPYYLVFPEAKRSELEFILRYFYSDRFARVLEAQGFLPLPTRERQRLGITLGID